MRRKRKIKKIIKLDPKYDNILAGKFINHLMSDGKKSVAQRVLYDAFDILGKAKEAKGKEPLEVFEQAVRNVSPLLEVKSRRVGGAHYQVPREVRGERKITLAIRWIIKAAKSKKGKPMSARLADELLAAFQNTGDAIKKKQDTRRMADANRAFAHFSW